MGGQESNRHRGEAHEEHAKQQHPLAAVRVAPVAEDESPDGAGDVADAVGCQRRDDNDGGVALREEDLRKDQRGGRGVDKS